MRQNSTGAQLRLRAGCFLPELERIWPCRKAWRSEDFCSGNRVGCVGFCRRHACLYRIQPVRFRTELIHLINAQHCRYGAMSPCSPIGRLDPPSVAVATYVTAGSAAFAKYRRAWVARGGYNIYKNVLSARSAGRERTGAHGWRIGLTFDGAKNRKMSKIRLTFGG